MRRFTLGLVLLAAACAAPGAGEPQWIELFDGETLTGWRGYRMESAPDGWQVVDGTLARTAPAGDLVTEREFGDFVLELEWRIEPGGNSGIFYGVTEESAAVWHTAPEMQVLDDAAQGEGLRPEHAAGADYDLHPPRVRAAQPAGAWNRVRLEVVGTHVRHFLNGELVVEFERWTPEWRALVAASKFAEFPDYGLAARGHLALQDHDSAVQYRRIRVLDLEGSR